MNLDFWLDPWRSTTSLWMVLTAVLATLACGLPGTFLVLRRMSLTGDALSHSVLPGIVLGFLVSGSLDSPWLVAGAAVSGWLAVSLIDFLHRRGGVREDAATGIVFTTLFALGVVMMRQVSSRIDLDPECVLFGNLETAILGARGTFLGIEWPAITLTTLGAAAVAGGFVVLHYHRLLAGSFDPAHARSLGLRPGRSQSALLGVTALVVVAAFQSVGAIMAVALLVLPGASGLMLARRLPGVLALAALHAVLAAAGGLYLATWLDVNFAAAVILAGGGCFALAAVFGRGPGAD